MLITCEGCGRGHDIPDERIPAFGARLRCAGCGRLFDVPAPEDSVAIRVNAHGDEPGLPELVVVERTSERRAEETPLVATTTVPKPVASTATVIDGAPAIEPVAPPPDVARPAPPVASSPTMTSDGAREEDPGILDPVPIDLDPDGPEVDARRLARMLLTDVAYADPGKLRTSREEGAVLRAYAVEIQRAWTFYCRRVGDDVARTTPYFRNAVREVLGGEGRSGT